MHSLAYAQKIEQNHRLMDDENSATWRAKAIETGKQLSARMGAEKYAELVDEMPNGKTWKYYCDWLTAANMDDESSYGVREQDWVGIQ